MNQEIILLDDDVIVLMPKKAICEGHVIVTPVQDILVLEQMPVSLLGKMMQIANKMSSVLFETLNCHGTNLLIQNGLPAGQINKFSINIIPRFENDGLKLEWSPKQAKPEQLDAALSALDSVDKKAAEEKYANSLKEKAETKKEKTMNDSEDNYFIKSLNRLP